MTAVVTRVALAPVYADATPRAEQVTQLVLGETATILEATGQWRKVAATHDGYEGWMHSGYLLEITSAAADAWQSAAGWTDGAIVRRDELDVAVPMRARLSPTSDRRVAFPDGSEGQVLRGTIHDMPRAIASAQTIPAEIWALERFAGAPYLWGGVTPWGVDCSGLVQTAFAARGITLPRDASQQIRCGVAVESLAPGDLLFFHSEQGPQISHVAFAGPDDTLIHSTIALGGVVIEPRLGSERGNALHRRLVAIRRIEQRA